MSKQVCYDAMRFSRGGGVVARDMIPHGVRSPVRTAYRTIDSDITNGELVFWTTCGPDTTFDPKITGVAGTWYFDDGTTLEAASGEVISKTFAAGGLHRAVYRPVGGLAAITGILAESDLLSGDFTGLFAACRNLTTITVYTNAGMAWNIDRIAANGKLTSLIAGASGCYGNLSSLRSTPIAYMDLGYNTRVVGTLADVPSTITLYVKLMACAGIRGSIADLATPTAQTVYLYSNAGITAGSVSALVAIRDLRIHSMGWLTADVDTVLLSIANAIVADPNHFTYATPVLQIGGTNEAPSGTYQAPTGPGGTPTSGLEAVWIMTHNAGHAWTVTATGGTYSPP